MKFLIATLLVLSACSSLKLMRCPETVNEDERLYKCKKP